MCARPFLFCRTNQTSGVRRQDRIDHLDALRLVAHIKEKSQVTIASFRRKNSYLRSAHQIAKDWRCTSRGSINFASDARNLVKKPRTIGVEEAHVVGDEQHASRRGDGPCERLALII